MGRLVTRSSIVSEFNPGSPYFEDDFGYDVGRATAHATKTSTFQAAGWASYKDFILNSNAAGWIYTRTAAQAATDLGYTGGTFPDPASRCLVLEGDPNLGTYDPGIGRQTDYWLQHNDWRPRIWWQYWEYLVSGTRSKGDKLWYPANWGTDNGFYLIADGKSVYEDSNPAWTLGQRTAFNDGSAANNRTFTGLVAAGLNGVDGRLVNSNSVSPGSQDWVCYQNVNTDHTSFGEWVLHKFFVDHSGAQGKYGYWTRRYGQAWVQHAYFEGGVTSGFNWSIPVGFRTMTQSMRTITTQNQYPPGEGTTSDGAHIRLWQRVQFADNEANLATYADEP